MAGVFRLEQYKNESSDRTISTRYLFDELAKLRGGRKISDPTRRVWKDFAGVPKAVKKGESKAHKVTPLEAAKIIFIALWDVEIKKELSSSHKSSDFTDGKVLGIEVRKLFNEWVTNCDTQAQKLLHEVYYGKGVSGKELKNIAEHLTKKTIPTTTIRRWFAGMGQSYRVNHVYEPGIVIQFLMIAQNANG